MIKTYDITLEGISPLLMNRPSQLDIGDKSKTSKREVNTPEQISESKLYKDSEDNVYLPATWFQGAIVEAGKQKKMLGKGSAKATYSKVAGSSVEINPFEIIIKDKWKVFSILAVNPTTKGKNVLHRPQFDKWKANFECTFDDEQIEVSVMKEIFDIAGRSVGVGDWRPAKKGRFGKFQVVSWKEKTK
jgi:hypothetical protein